jgi:hypothetical protein
MSSTSTRARPGTVTAVIVFTWLAAITAILGGIVALLISDAALAEAGVEKSTTMTYGIIELILGVVIALVAVGLSKGSNTSRILVSVLMGIRIVIGVYAIFALPNGIITGVVSVAAALIVLILLWNARATAFFTAS